MIQNDKAWGEKLGVHCYKILATCEVVILSEHKLRYIDGDRYMHTHVCTRTLIIYTDVYRILRKTVNFYTYINNK